MEMKSEKSLFVRSLTVDDIKEAVNLHIKCFPNSFLSHLGFKFLSLYYQEFVENDGNYGLLVCENKLIIGSLLGTSNSNNEFYSKFYKKNSLKLLFPIFYKVIVDKYLRVNIYGKKKHLFRAWESIWKKNKKTGDKKKIANKKNATLQSIYIDPQFRGSGGAKLLIDSFCDNLYLDGIKKVVLSVENDNQRAISFYKKCGWKEMTIKEHEIVFYKDLVEKN